MKKTFLKLSELSEEYRPLLLSELRLQKQADSSFLSKALEKGQEYAPAVGYGAAGGALAGVPVALLANALFGKDKSMRGHLRSALMGSILGGGVGALGAGGLRYYTEDPSVSIPLTRGLSNISGASARFLDRMGLGDFNRKGLTGELTPEGKFKEPFRGSDETYNTTRTQDVSDFIRKNFIAPH